MSGTRPGTVQGGTPHPALASRRLSLACLHRRYAEELEAACSKTEALGRGIAMFQGLSNIAFNCEYLNWGLQGTPPSPHALQEALQSCVWVFS